MSEVTTVGLDIAKNVFQAHGIDRLLTIIEAGGDECVPAAARDCLMALREGLVLVKRQILDANSCLASLQRAQPASRRDTGCRAADRNGDGCQHPRPHIFKSARDVPAWIGLVPKQNSTGGKERLGHISKAGNRYLRWLLVAGAMSLIRRAKQAGHMAAPTSSASPSINPLSTGSRPHMARSSRHRADYSLPMFTQEQTFEGRVPLSGVEQTLLTGRQNS